MEASEESNCFFKNTFLQIPDSAVVGLRNGWQNFEEKTYVLSAISRPTTLGQANSRK
jgi:hypothetical protein